ncbi:MAG: pyridoxal-dependent decarboxylase [Gemmatimonadaceae bacterium]|nr:pyridoxal-dependent decarboxylase [Gemmatimonadaceae bacterium]
MTHPTTDALSAPAPPLGDFDPAVLEAGVDQVLALFQRLHDAGALPPVLSRSTPGAIAAQLSPTAPAAPESLQRILEDVERIIVPGITHWHHPNFFAYFANSSSVPSLLGEFITSGLNANAMLWVTSPAATELEQRVLEWLWTAMGLPDAAHWFGIITDTASMSTLLAIAAAREQAGYDIRRKGMAGRTDLPVLRVYCSEHTHSSIDKACITLGIGTDNVVKIPVDASFRMRIDALEAAITADRAAGMKPLAVVATVGTTSTSSIDPVPAIAALCARESVWLHVDAAYAGVMGIAPEYRWVLDGVDRADSVVTNPHKWLFTTMDCSAFWTRHQDVLRRAFSLVAEYLVTARDSQVVNYMDYGVQLGRRFRALKLWMVMRAFGTDGLAARLREHCLLAREFAARVEADPAWRLCAPVPFSLVCFRYAPEGMTDADADAANAQILAAVNAAGRVYLSHTRLHGRHVLRLAIGNILTQREHVELAWSEVQRYVPA